MPKIVENEEYLNTTEAMKTLEASRQLFYNNARPYLKVYRFGAKKTPWYKKRDVIAFRDGKPIRKAYITIGGIFKDWTQHLASLGFQATTELNEVVSDVSLPEEAAEFFGISTERKFVKRSRHTLADGSVICSWCSYYPEELVGDVIDRMKHDLSFDVVAHIKEKHGVVINWSEEKTTARMTKLEELNTFRLPVDEATLILMRVSYAGNRDIIVFSSMVLLANWFVLHKEYPVNIWDEKPAS